VEVCQLQQLGLEWWPSIINLLHASIKEVTVVPENQDCMEEEADVTEMPVYSTNFDLDKESKKDMGACATVGVNHDWQEFATRDWVR
jgi:hypothetical protein